LKTSIQTVLLAALALSASAGCSTTVRSLTATAWIAPPDANGAAAAPAAVAPAPAAAPAEGQAPAAAAPAAGQGGLVVSNYYLTYWEGSCSGMMGCSRGDTKVKRCKVQPDNNVVCVDEANATKALQPN
jgi:hypothetical protein